MPLDHYVTLGRSGRKVSPFCLVSRPGVTSPILGARTETQLEDNLAAIDVRLAPEDIAALDEATTPTLDFATKFLLGSVTASYPGMVVNGRNFGVNSRAEQMKSK
jgi:hypothetical protein